MHVGYARTRDEAHTMWEEKEKEVTQEKGEEVTHEPSAKSIKKTHESRKFVGVYPTLSKSGQWRAQIYHKNECIAVGSVCCVCVEFVVC